MNSRERVLIALSGAKPDRAPFNFWMDRRLMADYAARFGGDAFRVTHFGADVIETFPLLDWPRGPHEERDGTAWQLGPCLYDWDEADDLSLPVAEDERVFEMIRYDLQQFPDKAIFLDTVTPWGVVSNIRTFELIMSDMIEHPEALKKLLGRIEAIYKPVVERACRLGITALYLMEDLASAQGLMFSPAMIREFCLDYVRSLSQIARSHGVPVLWHTDGKAMRIFEELIGMGVCAVNPLQPHLNDAVEFKQRFGDRLAVYGGLDNCFIIPNGSPDDIRAHVRDIFHKLGRDGGLIFSTHDIPIHTPPENIETMVRVITEECHY